jgi:hypothetical protein
MVVFLFLVLCTLIRYLVWLGAHYQRTIRRRMGIEFLCSSWHQSLDAVATVTHISLASFFLSFSAILFFICRKLKPGPLRDLL